MQSEQQRIRSFYYWKNKQANPILWCFLAKNFFTYNIDFNNGGIMCTICNKLFKNDFETLKHLESRKEFCNILIEDVPIPSPYNKTEGYIITSDLNYIEFRLGTFSKDQSSIVKCDDFLEIVNAGFYCYGKNKIKCFYCRLEISDCQNIASIHKFHMATKSICFKKRLSLEIRLSNLSNVERAKILEQSKETRKDSALLGKITIELNENNIIQLSTFNIPKKFKDFLKINHYIKLLNNFRISQNQQFDENILMKAVLMRLQYGVPFQNETEIKNYYKECQKLVNNNNNQLCEFKKKCTPQLNETLLLNDKICKVCHVNDACMMFRNCGHFVSCKNCLRSIAFCPKCKKRIQIFDVFQCFF